MEGDQQRDRTPTAASTSSEDFFSSYQFPASPCAPERSNTARNPLLTDPGTSRPSSLCDRRGSANTPIRISRRLGTSAAPTVRSVPTAHSHGQSTGPSAPSTQLFIAGRRSSTASIPRHPSWRDLSAAHPPINRRWSVQSVVSSRSSAHVIDRRRRSVASAPHFKTSQPRRTCALEPRTPLRPLSAAEGSPTSGLADFLRETGPEMAPPELDKLIDMRQRHSLDGLPPAGTPRSAPFPLGRGFGDPPRLRRLPSIDAGIIKPEVEGPREGHPLSCSAAPSSPSLEIADQRSGPLRPRNMLARSPVVDEQDAAATARALLATLSEEPPSALLRGATSSTRVCSGPNGAGTFPSRRLSRVEGSSRRLAPVSPGEAARWRAPAELRPSPTRTELVNVVPTLPRHTRRASHHGKRRSIASLRGESDQSSWPMTAHAHPANVSLRQFLSPMIRTY